MVESTLMDSSTPLRVVHVTGLPAGVVEEELYDFFTKEFGPLINSSQHIAGSRESKLSENLPCGNIHPNRQKERSQVKKGVELHDRGTNAASPFAFITFSDAAPSDVASRVLERCAAEGGRLNFGTGSCCVKLRRAPKSVRMSKIESNLSTKAARKAALEAKRPIWQPEMLDKLPRRESTLDQHVMVSQLSPELIDLVKIYLSHRFPTSSAEIAVALRWAWEMHPAALRVKELFETVEAFTLAAQQISLIRSRSRARSEGPKSNACQDIKDGFIEPEISADALPVIENIFDMACGHGLLGVLMAYRFPDVKVMCVDLERRHSFDNFVAAFKMHGTPDHVSGESEPLSNLQFMECNMDTVIVPARSFVICIHACNEANQIAIQMAEKAGAGYAAMPCCIPSGLYRVRSVRHVSDDVRYATMVGAMAGAFGAHTVASIDRRITNRNLFIFGGYPFDGSSDPTDLRDHGEHVHGQQPLAAPKGSQTY